MTQDKNHQELIRLRAKVRDLETVVANQAIRNQQMETSLEAMQLLVELRGKTIKELKEQSGCWLDGRTLIELMDIADYRNLEYDKAKITKPELRQMIRSN